jgi:hypothetical protein
MPTIKNNAKGKLIAGLSPSTVIINLDDTYAPDGTNYGGDAFWDTSDATTKPNDNSYMRLTIVEYNDQAGTEYEAIESGVLRREIIWIDGITGDALSVFQRAVDGTIAQSFSAGSYVYNFVNAGDMNAVIRMAIKNMRSLSFT